MDSDHFMILFPVFISSKSNDTFGDETQKKSLVWLDIVKVEAIAKK